MKTHLSSAALMTLLLGCSSDTIEPDGSQTTLTDVTAFCREWAVRACSADVQDACGSTVDECTASQASFCEDLVGQHYAFSENANACLSAVGDAYKTAVLSAQGVSLVLDLTAPCDALWAGSEGPGGDCTENQDCNTLEGYRCLIKLGEVTGQCHQPEEVAAGDPCDEPQHVCSTGRYCKDENCVRRLELGDACAFDEECDEALHCASDGAGGSGSEGACAERSSDTCRDHSDCQSGICSRDAADTEGECVARLHLYPKNELCAHLK